MPESLAIVVVSMRPAPARRDKRRASRAHAWSGHAWAIAGALAVTGLAFSRVLENDFVNWDDPASILNNQRLGAPGVVRWAFTTTFIEHYQPLAWLAWSAVKTSFGVRAAAFHGISLLGHLGNSLLVYLVALRLMSLAGLDLRRRRIAALTASAVFAIHPLRVEAVAWASAFPYVVSLGALLLAFLAYLNYAEAIDTRLPRSRARTTAWLTASVASYAASLLCRANAIGFPLVLLLVDIYPIGRRVRKTALLDKLPFLLLAIAAAVLESQAREIATWQEVGAGARLTMARTRRSSTSRGRWRRSISRRSTRCRSHPRWHGGRLSLAGAGWRRLARSRGGLVDDGRRSRWRRPLTSRRLRQSPG